MSLRPGAAPSTLGLFVGLPAFIFLSGGPEEAGGRGKGLVGRPGQKAV